MGLYDNNGAKPGEARSHNTLILEILLDMQALRRIHLSTDLQGGTLEALSAHTSSLKDEPTDISMFDSFALSNHNSL